MLRLYLLFCQGVARLPNRASGKYACKTQTQTDHRKAVLKLDVGMLHCSSRYRFGAALLPGAVASDCDTNEVACLHCRLSEGQPRCYASSLALLMIEHHRRCLAAAASLTCRLRQPRLLRSVRKTLLQLCHPPPMQMLLRLLVLQTQRYVISASSIGLANSSLDLEYYFWLLDSCDAECCVSATASNQVHSVEILVGVCDLQLAIVPTCLCGSSCSLHLWWQYAQLPAVIINSMLQSKDWCQFC